MAEENQILDITAEIVASHVANNAVAVGDMPDLIRKVHGALTGISRAAVHEETKTPAVSIKASLKPGYIVCMECGRKQKTLKRHLQMAHGMTPEQYRKDYGLPESYPLTAPNYSKRRREVAKKIGLGRKNVLARGG